MNNEYKSWNDKLEEFCQLWLNTEHLEDYEPITMEEFLRHMRHEENLKVLNRIADFLEKLTEVTP
jgi:hypothetical protein